MPKQMSPARPVVFLDRDGVINRVLIERGPRETPTVPAEFELLPGAKEALELLKANGFRLFVVTNQPNVAKGKSSWEDQKAIEARLKDLLGVEAAVDGVYSCYHHPDAEQVVVPELLSHCACRKPQPGLLFQARDEHHIQLSTAWLIGDNESDIEAGQAAGIPNAQLIFIGQRAGDEIVAVDNLLAAAHYITNYPIH